MIDQLRLVFKSYTKALEILYIIEDVKPVARLMIHQDDLPDVQRKLSELNLIFAEADFKIKMEVDPALKYSNKGVRIDYESEQKGWVILYVSKEHQKADLAKMHEEKNDHIKLGIALGYPACCVMFFAKHFSEQSQKNNDYILPIINDSYGANFDFKNNILLRYFDLTLLNHFPHSFECEESLKLAQQHIDVINKYDYYYKDKLCEKLKTTILYNEDYGIFVFHNAFYDKGLLRYANVDATGDNYLVNDFKRNKSVSYDKKLNRLTLQGKKYDNFYLLVFE